MSFQIAIDGPSGAGKSTISKSLANELGFIYVDTGAMYRAVGLFFLKNSIPLDDIVNIKNKIDDVKIEIKFINDTQHIFLNGEDVSDAIRVQEVADAASKMAVIEFVRTKLVSLQKEIAKNNNVIMDGRDIGTKVLPNANLKIYLDASSSVRAKRRQSELLEKGISSDFDTIKKEIEERDFRDMNRESSPLAKSNDAILIDTSDMSFEEVMITIKHFFDEVKSKTKGGS